jgi:hypothetical protein
MAGPALRFLRGFRRGRQPPEPWVVTEPNPAVPNPLPAFRFFAILGTWMEADVVAATVRNAFTQGCERVYLVDNDSSDGTTEAACAAGAVLARSYSSDSYDETLRLRLMNEVTEEVSRAAQAEHVWWLWHDADEFHHGPRGLTLRDYLATLDRRFRVVGARVFNHFPHQKPEYLPGFHPLEFQPLCQEFTVDHCPAGHWKHPLQRFDRTGPPIVSDIGFHKAHCDDQLIEPATPVFLHHFQYRDEAVTRGRLELLCSQDAGGRSRIALTDARWNGSGISKRFRTLDAVYRQRWERVANLQRQGEPLGVSPVPWREAIEPEHVPYAAWYGAEDVARARAAAMSADAAQTRS